jgi:hypothetical protein
VSGDQVTARFFLDLRDFEKNLQAGGEQVRNFEDRLTGAWTNATAGVDLMVRAVGRITDKIQEWVAASNEAEQAQTRLSRALQLQGQFSAEGLQELLEFNQAVQAQTGISGDLLTAIQAQLSAMGVYRGDLQAATRAVIGFSESHSVDLQSSVNIVGKAILGNVEGLRRYNVYVDDSNQAIRELGEGYQFAADRGETLEGALRKQTEASGDLDEALGKIFAKSTTWENFANAATANLNRITGWIDENQPKLTSFLDDVARGIGSAANFLTFGLTDIGPDVIVEPLPLPPPDTQQLETPNKVEESKAEKEEEKARERAQAKAGREAEAEERRRARQEKQDDLEFDRTIETFVKDLAEKSHRERADARAQELQEREEHNRQILALEDQKIQEETLKANLANETLRVQTEGKLSLLKQAGTQMASGIAGTIIAGASALAKGGAEIGSVISGALGGMLVTMGTTLAQAGIFAGVAALLGLIPALRPIFGEPTLSAGAAVAATTAGVAMIAIGSAMGGGGGGGGGSARGGSGGAGGLAGVAASGASEATRRRADEDARLERYLDQRNSGADTRPDGFRQSTGSTNITYEVHFPRNTLVIGSDREVGREVVRLAEEAKSLSGAPRGFG